MRHSDACPDEGFLKTRGNLHSVLPELYRRRALPSMMVFSGVGKGKTRGVGANSRLHDLERYEID